MTDRVVQITSKELQEIYRLVNLTKSWDSVGWHRFPTVPGHDPEKRGMIRIRATKADRVANYVFEMQKGGNARSAQCDVHISCKGGFIPCHKAVLMYFSPLLKGLITDNIREVGIPTPEQPIFIAMKDFRLEDMELALSFLYTGYSSFRVGNIRHILGILQFLGVDHDCEVEPVVQEVVRKKRKELVRYKDLSEVASEDEGDELTVEVQDNPGSGTSNTKQRESRDEQKTDGDPASSSSVDVKKEKPSPVRSPSASSASSHRTTKRPSTSPKPCSSKGPPRRRKKPVTSSSDGSGSSESDLEDLFRPVNGLTRAMVKQAKAAAAAAEAAGLPLVNTTLAERVKLKRGSTTPVKNTTPAPTPEKRKVSPSFLVKKKGPGRTGRPAPASVKRRNSLAVAEKKKSTPFTIDMSSRQPKSVSPVVSQAAQSAVINATKNSGSLERASSNKCFFCGNTFPTEEELLHHAEVCGAEIKGLYDYKNRKCLLCRQVFEVFSHFGLSRHVVDCKKTHSPKRSISGIPNLDDFVADLARDSAAGGDAQPGFERFPLGIPIVVFERIGDRRIARIKETVENGKTVDIPRVHNYNYVKPKVKEEPPDAITEGKSWEELMEMKRDFEKQQEESRKISEDRKRKKNGQVPKLRLPAHRVLSGGSDIRHNANAWYTTLLKCSHCSTFYETIDAATKCVKSHGLKQCWICFELLSKDTPIENHYRTTHNELMTPGEVLCPICKAPYKYANLLKHLKGHMKNVETNIVHEDSTAYNSQASEASTSHGKRRCTYVPVSYAEDPNESCEEYYETLNLERLLNKYTEHNRRLEEYGPHTENGKDSQKKMNLLTGIMHAKFVIEGTDNIIVQRSEPNAQVDVDNNSNPIISKAKPKSTSPQSSSELDKVKIGPRSRIQAMTNASLITQLLSKDASLHDTSTPVSQIDLPTPTASSKRKIGPKSKTQGRGRPKKRRVEVNNDSPPSSASNENQDSETLVTHPPVSNEVRKANLVAQMINKKLGETIDQIPTATPQNKNRRNKRVKSTASNSSQVLKPVSNTSNEASHAMNGEFRSIAMNIVGPETNKEMQQPESNLLITLESGDATKEAAAEPEPKNAVINNTSPAPIEEVDDDPHGIRIVDVTGSPDLADSPKSPQNESSRSCLIPSTGDQPSTPPSQSQTYSVIPSIPGLITTTKPVTTLDLSGAIVGSRTDDSIEKSSSNRLPVSSPTSSSQITFRVPNPLLRQGKKDSGRVFALKPTILNPPHSSSQPQLRTAAIVPASQRDTFDRSSLPYGTPIVTSVPQHIFIQQNLMARQAHNSQTMPHSQVAYPYTTTAASEMQSAVPSTSNGRHVQQNINTSMYSGQHYSRQQQQLVPYNQTQCSPGTSMSSIVSYQGQQYPQSTQSSYNSTPNFIRHQQQLSAHHHQHQIAHRHQHQGVIQHQQQGVIQHQQQGGIQHQQHGPLQHQQQGEIQRHLQHHQQQGEIQRHLQQQGEIQRHLHHHQQQGEIQRHLQQQVGVQYRQNPQSLRNPHMSLSYASLQISAPNPTQINEIANDGISRIIYMEQIHQLNEQVNAFNQRLDQPTFNASTSNVNLAIGNSNSHLSSVTTDATGQPMILAEGITVAAPSPSPEQEASTNEVIPNTRPKSAEEGVSRPVTELFKVRRQSSASPEPMRFCSNCQKCFESQINFENHIC